MSENAQQSTSPEEGFISNFNEANGKYWANRSDYDTANALLLRWMEDDLGVQSESNKLQQLFHDDFHFDTHVYAIPSKDSELELGVPPVHFSLSKAGLPSIVLKPLSLPVPAGFTRRERGASSFLLLRISLKDDPTGLQIANWLKSYPPDVVKDVDIEALVLKARRLENLDSEGFFFPGTVLGKISGSAQKEILRRLWGLRTAMSNTAAIVEDKTTDRLTEASKTSLATNLVADIQAQVAGVCDSVESGIILDPKTNLEEALDDAVSNVIGAQDTITLRQYILNTSCVPTVLELHRGAINWNVTRHPTNKARFRFGTYQTKSIIVESFYYPPSLTCSTDISENTMRQVQRIAQQLALPKRTNFHILPCIGYIREEHEDRLGLVFETTSQLSMTEPPIALRDVYSRKKRVPLGARMKVAHTLATIVESLHLVGWLHKEWKSSNVVFFANMSLLGRSQESVQENAAASVILSNPWLFGFETSRHEDDDSDLKTDYSIENNAYRHPERWGKPDIRFEKAHDVYALGVTLIEIAFWKSVMEFEEMKSPKLDPWEVKKRFLARNRKDIPHIAGQGFSDAVDVCLRFKELTEDFDELAANRYFKTKVLANLEPAACMVGLPMRDQEHR
ncbi:MAG: hypothetical protein Q9220_004536 [cf. Caloplaca sp. 1 TL-2023]